MASWWIPTSGSSSTGSMASFADFYGKQGRRGDRSALWTRLANEFRDPTGCNFVVKRIFQHLFLVLVGLAGVEVLLAVACVFSPVARYYLQNGNYTGSVPDAILGSRGNPFHWEFDANGYRNPEAVARVDIVALGDSHTAGSGVNSEAAWPRILADTAGASIYNMARGGYGPTHSFLQLDEALALSPKRVLVGVYFGNDLYDGFMHMRMVSSLRDLATPDLIDEAERYAEDHELKDDLGGLQTPSGPHGNLDAEEDDGVSVLKIVQLYRALDHVSKMRKKYNEEGSAYFRRFEEAARSAAREPDAGFSIFDGSRWRTIFTVERRRQVLDEGDPRVRVGLELTIRSIGAIKKRLEEEGVPLCVILLPTKETVYFSEVDDPSRYVGLSDLVTYELRSKQELIDQMKRLDIRYVDPLADLRSAEKAPYWESANGHPNHEGHRIIADSARDCLETDLTRR